MLDYQIISVLAIIFMLIVVLYFNLIKPSLAFCLAVVLMLCFQILTPIEALSGFGNEQLAIIVLLLAIGNVLKRTPMIENLFRGLFKESDSPNKFLLKMMTTVGLSSAFLNNTPLVAVSLPFVKSWSLSKKYSPSKFLIPLSYASILGGCITLVGTSTNLIANGLAVDAGEESLAIFDFVWVGLPMLVIGFLYILLFYKKLLPDHHQTTEDILKRSYFIETQINPRSKLIDQTIKDAGLRNLSGVFLVEIIRDNQIIQSPGPDTILNENDTLLFSGNTDNISELANPSLGISLPKECLLPQFQQQEVAEIVVSQNSRLAGKRVMDSNFRAQFDGAILAIHRNGEEISGKLGEAILQSGDVLLILTGDDFTTRIKDNPAFYVISTSDQIKRKDMGKSLLIVMGLLAALGAKIVFDYSLLVSLSAVILLSIFLRISSISEFRRSLDFDLIIIIALGLALGKGMVNTGAADLIATNSLVLLSNSSPIITLAAIFLVTNLLTAFMTSKASVAIILPIAITLGHQLNFPVEPFVLICAFGGAASFITPIGYQTNLMVFGPGRYTFNDFLKFGFPLTVIYMIVSTVILAFFYELI